MTIKDFQQFFSSDFSGIDGERSALETEGAYVNRIVNYEYSVGNSLRGRVGCQTQGSYGFFALFPYRYTRTQDQYDITYQIAAGTYPTQTPPLATTKTAADGASIEKLIALNQQIWVLDTMNITLTYVSGAYPFTWYSFVSGSNINFNIKANGVSILNTSLANGISSSTSIFSLLNTIDGLSELSVSRTTRGTCPPFAILNGNQTSSAGASTLYGTRYTWTVDAGHNFSAGDIVTWINSSTGRLQGGFVISTTATTIVYVGPQGTLLDDAVLGYMSQAATAFPISTASSASSGNLTLSIPYWRLIPEGADNAFGSIYNSAQTQWQNRSSGSWYLPAVAENASGNLYIGASSLVSAGSSTIANNLVKIDGRTAVRAGLPAPAIAFVNSGAGNVLSGTKYKCYFKRVDGQGNIIEGPLSNIVTTTANARYNTITVSGYLYSSAFGFQGRSAFKRTAEAPATGEFFYVDDNDSTGGGVLTAFLQPGDPICLIESDTAQLANLWFDAALSINLGTLHRTVCTDYCHNVATISPTASSIRVADSSGYTIPDDSPISTGLTVVILRTTGGGNQYYQLAEVPYTGYASVVIYDNVLDAALSAASQFAEPEIGKEHDSPPPCTLVCQHQGGLVVARAPTSPNTVGVSSSEGIEYFPTASNSFEVPSSQSGSITAIASDSEDRLAVFKDQAYYDVVGSVDDGNFGISIKNEGDYGIPSQASLVRTPFGLLGLSKLGWVTIQDGILDNYRFEEVNARVVNQAYQFSWAMAVNDSFNRNYICVIPQVSGEPVSFVFDYSRRPINPEQPIVKVFERSYTTQIDQAGGMAIVGDSFYHLSQTSPYGVFRRLQRFDSNSPSGNGDGDSFIDNTNAISYILESAPINRGEPSLLKTPIRIRIWSVPNDYIKEGWVAFAMTLETGASPLATYVGGSNNNATNTTVTFSASTDLMKEAKLKNCKTGFLILRLTTNTIRTSPFLTGYEILFAESYKDEDLVRP